MTLWARARAASASLSGRLLALTAAFVLAAEALIFAPALANFHSNWLRARADAAELAMIAATANPADPDVAAMIAALRAAGEIVSVRMERGAGAGPALRLAAAGDRPARRIDLDSQTLGAQIRATAASLLLPARGEIEVRARSRFGGRGEVVAMIRADALAGTVREQAGRVLAGSVFISVIAAALVYASLVQLFVQPMAALTGRIERFGASPLGTAPAAVWSSRGDEVGRAERALSDMERLVRQALRQRERLAGMGAAVAKIAHDLRASLASAKLIAERLAASEAPGVNAAAQRLERAIDRAVGLAQSTLTYARAGETEPNLQSLDVREALEEAAREAIPGSADMRWINAVPEGARALADAEHTHRIFSNLLRNAAAALASARDGRAGVIRATLGAEPGAMAVRIADSGPGVPERAIAGLFQPFQAGAAGSGLGLAIALELARAQGGEVALAETGPDGAAFIVRLRPEARSG